MALSGKSGPRAFKNGESLDAPHMEENWVMVWFAGARGWNRDSPWVVYLQRKPRSLRLDSNGLHFYFAAAAGDIVLLPLYGNYAAHGAGAESEEEFGGKQVKTWEWAEVLPREPLMRIRYWASALREFPTHCEDTRDGLTIRQKISWHSIRDDWGTKPLRLNPVSPTLAARSKDRTFPVKFSRPVMDLEMPTLYGPYMAAEGEAALEATFSNVITNGGTWKEWRQASGAKAHLVQMIEAAPGEWPRIALGQQWVIGEVIVSDDQAPGRTERVPINRNTEAVLCFP